jgi:hypothetical protein
MLGLSKLCAQLEGVFSTSFRVFGICRIVLSQCSRPMQYHELAWLYLPLASLYECRLALKGTGAPNSHAK